VEIHKEVKNLRLDGGIQRRYGFVTNDESRLDRKRARDADPLPLTAGEFVCFALAEPGIESHLAHQVANACLSSWASQQAMDDQRLSNSVVDRHSRIEAAVWILKNNLHFPPQPPQVGPTQTGHVAILEANPPIGDGLEPNDRPPRRRLTASRFADQSENLARPNVKRDVVNCSYAMIAPKPVK
jgi:hypothetical protein